MTARPILILSAGGTELAVKFVTKPLESAKDLAELRWNDRGLVEALLADILEPFLTQWTRKPGDRRGELNASVEAAMNQCIVAFEACAPERTRRGDRAVLAALTVTANLQRTLAHVGEQLARPRNRRAQRATLLIAREWAGLAAPVKRARAPGSVQFGPLARALDCSPAEIDARCREALRALRQDLRSGKWIERSDVEAAARRFPMGSEMA